MKDKMQNINKKEGQILVMSLFILLVLSIITLSTLVILSVDTRKKVFNESYDTNYFYSETRLVQTAEILADNYEFITFDALTPTTGIDPNLVGEWTLDEGSGTSAGDSTSNSQTATLINSPTWVSGVDRTGLSLNGTNQAISLSSPSQANVSGAEITISAWVNLNQDGNPHTVFHKERQYSLRIDNNGNFSWADSSLWNYESFGRRDIGFQFGKWEYITVVKQAGEVRIYLNGDLKYSRNFGGNITANNQGRTFFGCFANNTACTRNFTNGIIDEINVFNRSLTDDEIRDAYSVSNSEDFQFADGGEFGGSVAGATNNQLYNSLLDLYSEAIGDDNDADPDCTPNFDELDCVIQEDNITTEVTLRLKNTIDDIEMTSSDALQVDIFNDELGTSYTGPIRWRWTNPSNVVWSISLIYTKNYYNEVTNTILPQFEIVKDIYDCRNISTSGCDTNKLTASNYTASSGLSVNRNEGVEISLDPSSITDELHNAGNINSVFLRLRPIILDDSVITVNLEGSSSLPIQFAEIDSQSYESGIGVSAPSPFLSLKLPLVPAPPALYDYVYYQSR